MGASGNRKAAWLLVALAPLSAEVAFSGIYLLGIWPALPLLVLFYGAGVLLVRELAVRAGSGWPGVLVLGLAYEVVEDGFGLQALTSPHLYSAADWGPRVLGFNLPYWQSQIGYHLAFSVLIPIALTELIFRQRERRPYLGRGGLIAAAVAFVVGIAAVRLVISGFEDPGYQTPWPAVVAEVVLVVALGVVALVVIPRMRPIRPTPARHVPHPATVVTVAVASPIVVHGLLFPLGFDVASPALGRAVPTWIPMIVALVIAVAAGWLVARWWTSEEFTDRHRILLIGGALVGHSVFAVAAGLVHGLYLVSPVIGAVVIVATVAGLAGVGRRAGRIAGGVVPSAIRPSSS